MWSGSHLEKLADEWRLLDKVNCIRGSVIWLRKRVGSAALIRTCNARADCGRCLMQMRDGCCPPFFLSANKYMAPWMIRLSKTKRVKKVWTFVFGRSYLCHFIVGVESAVIRQLVHFPFEWCTFCKDHGLRDDKRIWEMGEVPRKMWQISLPLKTVYSSVGIDFCFEFFFF